MARNITFNDGAESFSAGIIKVDRKKIYGYSTVQVTDKDNKKCSLVSLSDDGTHILPSGSTGIAKLDSKENYIDASKIKAVDLNGEDAEKVPSVFDQEVSLKKVESITDYLDLNVKSIYQLSFEEDAEKADLIKKLDDHLYEFIFNYRADYEGDDAFLTTDGTEVFAVIGKKCEFEYLGLKEIAVDDTAEDDEEEDDFDFGML